MLNGSHGSRSKNEIDAFVSEADFLPPSFQLLPRLLLLLDDDEANADSIAELIRVDPGLTADILRVCNSAAFSLDQPAESIQEAMLRLGFREVHRTIMAVIASPILKNKDGAYGVPEADLWSHSLAAAVATQTFGGGRINAEVAFTAALLHDVGKLVLSQVLRGEYAKLLTFAQERNQSLYEAERALLRTDHAEVGAQLLKRWGFPSAIVDAVRHHHEPTRAREDRVLASGLYLANVLAHRLEDRVLLPKYVFFPDTAPLKEMHLTQPELEADIAGLREEFRAAQERFR